MVSMRGIRGGTLYKLLGRFDASIFHPIVIPNINKISSLVVNSTMLWHRCLGHINEKGLRATHNKGMVEGFLDCSSKFISMNTISMVNKIK